MIHPLKQRSYWLMLKQDLFGTWCVCKIYGGLTNKHCREIWTAFNSQTEASKALTEIEYKRRQRGYIYHDNHDVDHFYLKPQIINEVS